MARPFIHGAQSHHLWQRRGTDCGRRSPDCPQTNPGRPARPRTLPAPGGGSGPPCRTARHVPMSAPYGWRAGRHNAASVVGLRDALLTVGVCGDGRLPTRNRCGVYGANRGRTRPATGPAAVRPTAVVGSAAGASVGAAETAAAPLSERRRRQRRLCRSGAAETAAAPRADESPGPCPTRAEFAAVTLGLMWLPPGRDSAVQRRDCQLEIV